MMFGCSIYLFFSHILSLCRSIAFKIMSPYSLHHDHVTMSSNLRPDPIPSIHITSQPSFTESLDILPHNPSPHLFPPDTTSFIQTTRHHTHQNKTIITINFSTSKTKLSLLPFHSTCLPTSHRYRKSNSYFNTNKQQAINTFDQLSKQFHSISLQI